LKLPSERTTYFNFLASHDGIGLNPIRGILTDAEIEDLVQRTKARGGLVSFKTDSNGMQSPYELNINYLDALSNPDEPVDIMLKRFITAHAILLAIAGIPGIYFHSLFGSRGWPEGVIQTGHNRSINREKLDRSALQAELENTHSLRSQVFIHFKHLISVRTQNPAFKPQSEQHVLKVNSEVFALLRIDKYFEKSVLCFHNVSAKTILVNADLSLLPYKYPIRLLDLISNEQIDVVEKSLTFTLAPYQSAWFAN
jgi:sucrose phosphorylase